MKNDLSNHYFQSKMPLIPITSCALSCALTLCLLDSVFNNLLFYNDFFGGDGWN